MSEMTKEEKVEALRMMIGSAGWQKVLKPALLSAIVATQQQWMSNSRAKGEESISDESLKMRAASLSWVLAWEQRYVELVNQLDQLQRLNESTEPAAEGGSPY